MSILRNNSQAIFFLLVAVCLGAASGFQQTAVPLRSLSVGTTRPATMKILQALPPQYDDEEFDATPFGENVPVEAQGIPKLQIPKPNLSVPEFDFKEVLKRVAALAATVVAFVIIQKVGLQASEIFTPELSPEQVRDFQL